MYYATVNSSKICTTIIESDTVSNFGDGKLGVNYFEIDSCDEKYLGAYHNGTEFILNPNVGNYYFDEGTKTFVEYPQFKPPTEE